MYKNILLGFEFEVETYGQEDTYAFIDEVSHITAYNEHRVYNYHSSSYRTINNAWRVEDDNSILGAEFISPPIYYNEAKKMVKEFFRAIEGSANAMITDNCGLHVGMSINGTVEGLDLSSFLISLDQRLIASLWPERIKNRYVRNIGEQIKRFKHDNKNINIENFAKHLFYSRHTFISLKEFNYKKYLELRIPGGKNYHRKFKELFALIDHVASKMLSNHSLYNSNLPVVDSKKCTRKITSYVNRMLKYDQGNAVSNFKTANEKLGSEKLLTISVISSILDLAIVQIEYIYSTWNLLNKDCFLYNLIKYCVIYRKEYLEYYIKENIDHFLKLVKKLAPSVDIPKKESTYNKVKIFKHWNRLPTFLVTDLLSSIDSKHAYRYLIKHVQGGVLHAIVTDSRGILKKHAITHAYKYNKVK